VSAVADYEHRSTAQLQAELRSRGLSDAGRTEELIERLRADDADRAAGDDEASGEEAGGRADGADAHEDSDPPPRGDDGRFVSQEEAGDAERDETPADDHHERREAATSAAASDRTETADDDTETAEDTESGDDADAGDESATTDEGTPDDADRATSTAGRTGLAATSRRDDPHDGERAGGVRMPVNTAHERYMDMLLEHAAERRYPSHHMLHRVEEMITDRAGAEAYVDVLLTEAESQRYPSHHMLERAKRVIVQMVLADEAARIRREIAEHRERAREAEATD
jgi:hypothetical protein